MSGRHCKVSVVFIFQVFDTNENAEKLFRFKLGKGKVIKVRLCVLSL